MSSVLCKLKSIVAATCFFVAATGMAAGQSVRLDPLFDRLKNVDAADALALEAKIRQEWSKSGSPAADLLLSRAKIAIDAGDQKTAMGYLTALTDHTPKFAEGWNLSAVTLFNMGKIGPALAALERALSLEPRHFQALEGLVLIFDDAGLYQEAFEILRRIEAIHPHAEIISKARSRLEAKTLGQAL
ncbi:tetratricopeptide repeat protein [uncultured Planktomarina sp.]|uniref:tetratricopeptide repeat protein n=1 Tax=uncultured Planktomarina sp. TaxID=1538529 RepID=UPI00325FDFA9